MLPKLFESSILISFLNGSWADISNIEPQQIVNFEDRVLFALMIATACSQLNDSKRAKSWVRFGLEWGASPQLAAKYLLSSSQRKLADCFALEPSSSSKSDHYLQNALSMLGFENRFELIGHEGKGKESLRTNELVEKQHFSVNQLARVELGKGWSGNTVNTVVFRHSGLLTVEGLQFAAFYVDEETLRVVSRCLSSEKIDSYDIHGNFSLLDAHNSISFGVDRCGYVHICYDQHSTTLRYRRSLNPLSVFGWTSEMAMTGKNEDQVTYPTFIQPKAGNPLLLMYRDGIWKKGTVFLKRYDEQQKSWVDYPQAILSGADNRPWTSNAYWNNPVIDDNGNLYLTFCWRTDYFSKEMLVNNVDISFAKSYDAGLSWYSSNNMPFKLPITQVNSETIYPISPGSNLINQTSMALDSAGHPHVVFYANDIDNIPQYMHLWFDGYRWQCTSISKRNRGFSLRGGGTLQIPISRPEIVIDKEDNVFVIYRGDITQQRMSVVLLRAPFYEFDCSNVKVLCHDEVGFAEPVIDKERWRKEEVLSIFLQKNKQPDGDVIPEYSTSPIVIVDVTFKLS